MTEEEKQTLLGALNAHYARSKGLWSKGEYERARQIVLVAAEKEKQRNLAVRALQEVEWGVKKEGLMGNWRVCPACNATRSGGHYAHCKLWAALEMERYFRKVHAIEKLVLDT